MSSQKEMMIYLGIISLGPALIVFCAVLVYRRNALFGPPLVRVELVGGSPGEAIPSGYFTAPNEAHALAIRAAEEIEEPTARNAEVVTEHPPQAFELGPTFEEERDARIAEQRDREQALLRQVFESNLLLCESAADRAGSPAAAGVN